MGQTDGPVDYDAMEDWWRGLIALRLSRVGEVFRVGEAVPEGWVREVPSDTDASLGYVIGDRVLVLINAGEEGATFDVPLGATGWRLVANSDAPCLITAPTLSARL